MSQKNRKRNNAKLNKNPEIKVKRTKAVQTFIIPALENTSNLILIFFVLLFGFILYYRITGFGYIQFDDDSFIKRFNDLIFAGKTAGDMFTDTFGASFYRPILSLAFFFDAKIGGMEPYIYYITNFLIYLTSLVLMYILLKKFNFSKTLSVLLTALFAVHPLLTPAVSWISGRNDSMLMLFFVSAMILLIMSSENEDKPAGSYYFFIHIALFALAMFTKESAVIYPVIFFLYLIWFKKYKVKSFFMIRLIVSWGIVILIYFLARSQSPVYLTKHDIYGINAVLMNIWSLFAITGKIFLPIKMNGCSQYENLSIISGIISFIVLVGLPFIFKKDFNKKFYYFGLAWFYIAIFPTLSVKVHITNYDYLEHRSYASIPGIMLALGYLLSRISKNNIKTYMISLLVLVIGLFAIKSYSYTEAFSNPYNFWESTINTYPDIFQGYLSMGRYYFTKDDIPNADKYINLALKYGSDRYDVYQALSTIETRKGNYKKAEEYANKSISLNSDNGYAFTSLTGALIGQNLIDKAIEAGERAVFLDKTIPDAYYNLALGYYIKKDYKKAISNFELCTNLNRGYARAYSNIGACYFLMGNNQLAEQNFLNALSINPVLPEAANNLIKIYMQNNVNRAKQVAQIYTSKGGRLEPQVIEMLNKAR